MSDPVNLNRARKARQKAAREQQAAENRVKFGRTRAEKQMEAAQAEKRELFVRAHRREGPGTEG